MDSLHLRVALRKFNQVSKALADLGEAMTHISTRPTLMGAAGAFLQVGGRLLAEHLGALQREPAWPKATLPVSHRWLDPWEDPTLPDLYTIGNQRVLWSKKNAVFLVEKSIEEFYAHVRDAVWASVEGRPLVYRRGEQQSELVPDVDHATQSSPRTEEIWARIEPCVRAGIPRSVLLDGPPGVGKSTAARVLASRIPGRSLRILLEEYSQSECHVVELLRPTSLVIDDFDRLGGDAPSLLEFLEQCRKYVKLLVVTSNNLGNLDMAVVRPGRFDEIFPMTCLGTDYLEPQVGQALWAALSPSQRTELLTWPAAHLQELKIRHQYIACNLQEEFNDLAERVQKNLKNLPLERASIRRRRKSNATLSFFTTEEENE